jgi:hypothetical protein
MSQGKNRGAKPCGVVEWCLRKFREFGFGGGARRSLARCAFVGRWAAKRVADRTLNPLPLVAESVATSTLAGDLAGDEKRSPAPRMRRGGLA